MVLPGMSDGRQFTNYESNCKYNLELMKQFHAKDEKEYREKLQSTKMT